MSAMLDCFTVLHKGGTVLWRKEMCALQGEPINDLIKTVLLEERSAETVYKKDQYQFKWALVNEFDLVFVMVYTSAVSLLLVDELLEALKSSFVKMFKEKICALPKPNNKLDFEKEFQRIMYKHEQDLQAYRTRGQKQFSDTAIAKDIMTPQQKKEMALRAAADKEKGDDDEDDDDDKTNDSLGGPAAKKGERKQRSFVKKDKKKDDTNSPGKKKRNWDPLTAGPGQEGQLDRSTDKPGDARAADNQDEKEYLGSGVADVDNWDVGSEGEEEEEAKDKKKSGSKGIFSYLQSITGSRALEKSDLEPVLAQFKELLINKNVASEIAEKLCSSVAVSLEGKTISGFNGVKKAVRGALEEGLTRILTPKQSMDILRDIKTAQAQGRPYVVVFVGVNGVGKSTSLSKVCFWLKSQGLKVMLAACDTFRSGAVEQLKTHAARLDVPVYERGYNKDAASIAMDAVKDAASKGFDVVLVDTAGRMQDNEPLMRALSKLVNLNSPDLVLFVGEALVGNEAIDQVTKFNQALKETNYGSGQPRLIDGIMLTKFDTIDDKVGAAVSMVYVTGQPVVLVGVGQTYTDLKKLNAHNIVKLLLR
mmetsp:Transcript_37765/g.89345  ORF Transcript_37765/g.89345 Transcript_37765/m.89345 type:complete len:591 (+) Transcript_37765:168-1940(+)